MARTLRVIWPAGLAIVFAAASLSGAAYAGDATKGADVFKKMCSSCHTIEKGAGNGALGPNLFGVSGRKAASAPNFGYSPAIRNSGIVWTDDKLKSWVQNPQKLIPGSKMILIHTPSAEQAEDVVTYVDTKK
jgi:cytochrome c